MLCHTIATVLLFSRFFSRVDAANKSVIPAVNRLLAGASKPNNDVATSVMQSGFFPITFLDT